ncbi:26s proteasome non-atpase regulatory subunit 9 [Stylonychia lemnae]|uniref:26s proteasome non-atpase regulatory subunit 9 n=1 Tax=Stylonychia lemnae TaxID=5949 RepID=A0A077ZT25_STYLE|nr:26s proteasome non-atpase regulatory subunit 9 [Stylonychia lemnae]|eukprot:CDW73038.1 26s proteasome non-atpase regulatory subunit 9 [Stylonychia lemnae]
MKLMNQKDEIEKLILDITEFLETPPMPGVKGTLVDAEGFPRADIDLFEVRKMRNKLACLQTDHCTVMKQIEEGLLSVHDDYKKNNINIEGEELKTQSNFEKMSVSSANPDNLIKQNLEVRIPFAWISDVINDSPAQQAGLKMGDAIYKFGDVDHSNHENLNAIVELVKKSLNNPIQVKVLRKNLFGGSEEKEIQFVPHEWGGRGYLGCALKLNPI